MTKQTNKTQSSTRAPKRKSELRKTKANYDFDVFADEWRLCANNQLNFILLSELELTPKFEKYFRLALADYACEFSSSYVQNLFNFCRKLFSFGVESTIKEKHLLNFKGSLNKKTEYLLGYIRAFLFSWSDKKIGGIDKKAVALLESLTLSGNTKGKAVAIGCPYSGAYSSDEQVAFLNWYVNAYTSRQINLDEYAFIMSLQMTGARPVQITRLYMEDLITEVNEGMTTFGLNLPNAKKRNESFRDSFQKKEAVNEDLILVLQAQAKQSIQYLEQKYKITLSPEQQKTVPIFLNLGAVDDIDSYNQFSKTQQSTPDLLCVTSNFVTYLIRRMAHICPLKTQRIKVDGEYGDLHINPRRFRYTHATNLAMLGASAYVIAEELGHADTQQVNVYTEFNEEIANRLDAALEPALTPLAQAFSGTLIDSEKDAIRVNDPRSRIGNSEGNPVGNCGQYGFCADGTIHCYTCNKFQPWVNAPHEQVLNGLLAEREAKAKMGASEFVLQGYNRSIDAIRVVIGFCDKRKEELSKQGAFDV